MFSSSVFISQEARISLTHVTLCVCVLLVTVSALTWSTQVLLCSSRVQRRLMGRWLRISAGVSLKRTAGGSYTPPLRWAEVCLAACSGAVEGDEDNLKVV